MLRRLNKMSGFSIHTTDGKSGHVEDFYFDVHTWCVRYLVVKTGPWLFGRNVLISPVAIDAPDWASETLYLKLTKEEVEKSPELALDIPVTRQHESTLNRYYGWPNYWMMDPAVATATPEPFVPVEAGAAGEERTADHAVDETIAAEAESYLRSVKDTQGYAIQATDQEIGHIEDFFADEDGWRIRYALVDTSRWLTGKHVLISPDWIDEVDWAERQVRVHVDHEKIENSPEYDAREAPQREHEIELYSHYGYPFYWGV